MTIFSSLIISTMLAQSTPHIIKFVDAESKPIVGAYVSSPKFKFLYSNQEGIVKLPQLQYAAGDSLSVSHLSYSPTAFAINKLMGDTATITLQSDIKELKMVTISALDITAYVHEVMAGLKSKYANTMATEGINLAGQVSLMRDNDNYPLIDYKGELLLSRDKKGKMLAATLPQEFFVADDLKKNIFHLKPHHMLTMVSPLSHPVVRRYKEVKFHDHEYVTYKGCDALKVQFSVNRKSGAQDGYIIINLADDALMSVMYDIYPYSPFIIGLSFKGLTKTSMLGCYVEADYIKDATGKYEFDSGRQSISINTSEKGKNVQVTSDIKLKRTLLSNEILGQEKVKIEDLFK